MAGRPTDLAGRIAALAHEHRPDSLGLALVDSIDLPTMTDGALETIDALRQIVG